jgi:hypothetical protein
MTTTPDPAPADRPPGRSLGQDIGVALWSSFLAAGLATMCFFATFDPNVLHEDAEILRGAFSPRMTGYTLGFFFFWSFTLLAAGLSVYLIRGRARRDRPDSPADGA